MRITTVIALLIWWSPLKQRLMASKQIRNITRVLLLLFIIYPAMLSLACRQMHYRKGFHNLAKRQPPFASCVSQQMAMSTEQHTLEGLSDSNELISTPSYLDQKPTDEEVDSLFSFLRTKRNVLVISGAGISTSSGVPDYRGPQGSYKLGLPNATVHTWLCFLILLFSLFLWWQYDMCIPLISDLTCLSEQVISLWFIPISWTRSSQGRDIGRDRWYDFLSSSYLLHNSLTVDYKTSEFITAQYSFTVCLWHKSMKKHTYFFKHLQTPSFILYWQQKN